MILICSCWFEMEDGNRPVQVSTIRLKQMTVNLIDLNLAPSSHSAVFRPLGTSGHRAAAAGLCCRRAGRPARRNVRNRTEVLEEWDHRQNRKSFRARTRTPLRQPEARRYIRRQCQDAPDRFGQREFRCPADRWLMLRFNHPGKGTNLHAHAKIVLYWILVTV